MIKKFLPKTLFYRYFLIIITPVIFLQITLMIVFFDSLWLKTNKGLVNSLSDEISTFINIYQDGKTDKDREITLNLFKKNKPYDIKIIEGRIQKEEDYSKFAFYDRLLKEEFEKNWLETGVGTHMFLQSLQIIKDLLFKFSDNCKNVVKIAFLLLFCNLK